MIPMSVNDSGGNKWPVTSARRFVLEVKTVPLSGRITAARDGPCCRRPPPHLSLSPDWLENERDLFGNIFGCHWEANIGLNHI